MKCDTSWKSSAKFLNTWQLKLMDLEEIRYETIIPDSQKRQWLESALAVDKDMTAAISNAQNNKIMVQIYLEQYMPGGYEHMVKRDDLPFDKYFAFLLDHAKRVDETSECHTPRRNVVGTTVPKRGRTAQ